MRERLLAEHLGCTAQDVAHATERAGSLHAAIASLDRGGERTLPSVEPDFDATLDAVVPDRHLFDPERALDAETIVADLLPQDDARTDTRGRLIGIAAGVALLAAMALAWRVTPLRRMARVRPSDRRRRCAARQSVGGGRRGPDRTPLAASSLFRCWC